jgi:hypothetical protein
VPNSLLEIGGFARDTYWDGPACLGVTHSSQASAEHFQQCAEFLPLRNRGLGPLAVTVLPISLTRRAATTPCAAVPSAASFCRRRPSICRTRIAHGDGVDPQGRAFSCLPRASPITMATGGTRLAGITRSALMDFCHSDNSTSESRRARQMASAPSLAGLH